MNSLALALQTARGRDPLQVILFVTSRCNLRCDVCFYWREIADAKARGELSLDELRQLSRSMRRFPWLLIGGGEPTLRQDLAEVIGQFVGHNGVRYVSIPTSGFYRDRTEALLRTLCKQWPQTHFLVTLSLHELDAAHDAIVGAPGAFARLCETHGALRALQGEYGNLGVGAVLTMSRRNQARCQAVLQRMIDTMGFDAIILTKARGEPKDVALTDVDPDTYAAACRYLEAAASAGRLPGYRGLAGAIAQAKDRQSHADILAIMRGHGYIRPCQSARLSVVIDERGDVYPCEILDEKLGSLRDHGMDFQAVWRGPDAERMRTWIHETRCHCTHECPLAINIMADPAAATGVVARGVLQQLRRSLPSR